MTIPQSTLDHWTRLASEATEGPWDVMQSRTLHHLETACDNPNGAGRPVCSIPKARASGAAFIAAARTAVPELIAEVVALRGAMQSAKAALDTARPAFTNLTTHQRQLDADGCEVGVSRQAVDESVDTILHILRLGLSAQPHADENRRAA